MEWRHNGSQHCCPKIPSAKIGCRISGLNFFWMDQEGILLIDCLPKVQNISAEYYSSVLVQLKDILKEKTPREVKQEGLVLTRQCPD